MADTLSISKSTLWKAGLGIFVMLIGLYFFGPFSPTGNVVEPTLTAAVSNNGEVQITTTLKNFKYTPDVITVNRGDKVFLTIINKDKINHALNMNQYGIGGSISALSTRTISFIAIETATNGHPISTCSHGERITINVI